MNQAFGVEHHFDAAFTADLARREKQIQQSYRPIIGIHKWFARRPGSVFRNLLLAEFNGEVPPDRSYWQAHSCSGVIADPFMGGGTPIFEANRLGFSVVGTDINPMAFWVVRQSLSALDLEAFIRTARAVVLDVEKVVGGLYRTRCTKCGGAAHAKYFLWVKTQNCPECGILNSLFPGHLLAEARRHPMNVVVCSKCGFLNEYNRKPSQEKPEHCARCASSVFLDGPARRNKCTCQSCGANFSYPPKAAQAPPQHRLWAIEYHCKQCKPGHTGRFFKEPDGDDLSNALCAESMLDHWKNDLPIPDDAIEDGDETRRLHRWGYARFREMFNARQLFGLGTLLKRICDVTTPEIRHALLTVFSDFIRYQNMLCRYDTYALKCQDIFSVHGFPVGLVQCENNLLGIPRVGSGSFRHFIEKYQRAKEYCREPFETRVTGKRKRIVPIWGEKIEAEIVEDFPNGDRRQAWLMATSATDILLPSDSLDGVFTDPPYFDNVQYAELMDFCYVWLRQALGEEFDAFVPSTTRTQSELTGNITMGRGLEQFTEGLSKVFLHFAKALKPSSPFVFTYHHNDPQAYVPLIVAILDAGLDCTATLPAPAEMGASLHIARSRSSVLDTVFVCRRFQSPTAGLPPEVNLIRDIEALGRAGIKVTDGDTACLMAGHIARMAINQLQNDWITTQRLADRMERARVTVDDIRTTTEKPGKKRSSRLSTRRARHEATL